MLLLPIREGWCLESAPDGRGSRCSSGGRHGRGLRPNQGVNKAWLTSRVSQEGDGWYERSNGRLKHSDRRGFSTDQFPHLVGIPIVFYNNIRFTPSLR